MTDENHTHQEQEEECLLCLNPKNMVELHFVLLEHNLEVGDYVLKRGQKKGYIVVMDNGEEVVHEHLENAILLLLRMVGIYTKKDQTIPA